MLLLMVSKCLRWAARLCLRIGSHADDVDCRQMRMEEYEFV